MLIKLYQWIVNLFKPKKAPIPESLSSEAKLFLLNTVSFYQSLSEEDRLRFEARASLFLQTTEIVGHDVEVTIQDELLVASGAVIPVWGFEGWHYFNLQTVYLVSGSFNEQSQFGQPDSNILGLVGNGHLSGSMILSKPALHYGFSNDQDKQNVAIHEFIHLLDMADGEADGFPERLLNFSYAVPWFALAQRKINEIKKRNSNIRAYATTNDIEFLAVVSEYFFERPAMMQKKHPELFKSLQALYRQENLALKKDKKISKKAPCPCGSGKRYKRCCLKA